jgi:hypothetical protein
MGVSGVTGNRCSKVDAEHGASRDECPANPFASTENSALVWDRGNRIHGCLRGRERALSSRICLPNARELAAEHPHRPLGREYLWVGSVMSKLLSVRLRVWNPAGGAPDGFDCLGQPEPAVKAGVFAARHSMHAARYGLGGGVELDQQLDGGCGGDRSSVARWCCCRVRMPLMIFVFARTRFAKIGPGPRCGCSCPS